MHTLDAFAANQPFKQHDSQVIKQKHNCVFLEQVLLPIPISKGRRPSLSPPPLTTVTLSL
jgi:hypothetical protein